MHVFPADGDTLRKFLPPALIESPDAELETRLEIDIEGIVRVGGGGGVVVVVGRRREVKLETHGSSVRDGDTGVEEVCHHAIQRTSPVFARVHIPLTRSHETCPVL
jgi:hypothetical protein